LGKLRLLPKILQHLLGTVLVFTEFKVCSLGKRLGLTIEEVDKLTGPVIGRPKSATLEL
jgi:3-hydroxyacyl-CoA dehydrogenase